MPSIDPPRRLNLGDLVIAVVAVAVFLSLARHSWQNPPHGQRAMVFGQGNWTASFHGVCPALMVELVGEGLAVASLALIALRGRMPRPGWRRLMRQPGWIAATCGSLGAAIGWAVDQGQNASEVAYQRSQGRLSGVPPLAWLLFPDGAVLAGGLAVVVAWLVLAGAGVLHPERSAIDRVGRVVGLGWIILPLVRLGYGTARIVWP